MVAPLRVIYPDGIDWIRVIFHDDGAVSIRPPVNLNQGDEYEGELSIEMLTSREVSKLMGFAYRCGGADLLRKFVDQGPMSIKK